MDALEPRRTPYDHDDDSPARSFVTYLQSLVNTLTRPQRIALLSIGLDRFTMINEVFGRDVGDRVLDEVELRLRQSARGMCQTVARLGGDRFAVILLETHSLADAEAAVVRALAHLARPIEAGSRHVRLTASAGVVELPVSPETTATSLLSLAGRALDWAKSDGRDRHRVFTEHRNDHERRRRDLASDLPLAMEGGEIIVYYQQLQSLRVRQPEIVGFEALARWQHPRFDLLQPQEFIGLATELGMIRALGTHVLRCACRDAARWLQTGRTRLYVSVNVAAEQLTDPGFVDIVRTALDDAGLPAHLLHLELTESATIQTDRDTLGTLRSLTELGVSLVLDDFGSGYSNLHLLPTLPLAGLKLDYGFIPRLADQTQRPFLKNVIALGRALNLRITAEGIETPGQAEAMRKLGCNIGQGWLFGRPVPNEEVNQVIQTDRRGYLNRIGSHRMATTTRRRRIRASVEGLFRGVQRHQADPLLPSGLPAA